METWVAWFLIIISLLTTLVALVYMKLFEKTDQKLKKTNEENEQLNRENKKLKYEKECLVKQLNRIKKNSLTKDIREMACVIRMNTINCIKCEHILEDGSCKKPINYFCDTDENILITCDILCDAGYGSQSESDTNKLI